MSTSGSVNRHLVEHLLVTGAMLCPAGALERTLAEVLPPYGLSELSDTLSIDAGDVSRLLGGLADELIIEPQPRRPVERVDWEAMIRQIAQTYSLLDSNDTTSSIAPAGPEQFLRDLTSSKLRRWAVTGSFASSLLVSIAAPTVAVGLHRRSGASRRHRPAPSDQNRRQRRHSPCRRSDRVRPHMGARWIGVRFFVPGDGRLSDGVWTHAARGRGASGVDAPESTEVAGTFAHGDGRVAMNASTGARDHSE